MKTKYLVLAFLLYTSCLSINSYCQININDSSLNIQEFENGYKMLYKDTLNKKALIVFKTPSYRGGIDAYNKFLQKNLDADLGPKYLKVKRRDSIAQQTVEVEFFVTKTGAVTDVKPLNARFCHPKLVDEAVRVIENSNRWIPAEIELFFDDKTSSAIDQAKTKITLGKGLTKVVYRHVQKITFMVTRE